MRLLVQLFLLLLVTGFHAIAQDPFDEAYDKIWQESAHSDLNTSLRSADSLYRATSLPVNRLRSLMLIARLYQQQEDLEKSVEYALKIEQLAMETGDYAWQARAEGYLAGLYRMMEFYDKAKAYSRKALEVIPRIKDTEQANSTRGLMLQELAFACKDEKNYKQAILHLKEAGKSIGKIKHNRAFNLMNNERLLGDNYRLLQRYDTALLHYKKALALSSDLPVHYVTGLVQKGIAEALLEKGDLQGAKIYLDKAERIADESQYLQLKDAVYALSKEYYARVKDKEKLMIAREKNNSVTDTLLDKRARLLDKMYTRLQQDELQVKAASNRKDAAVWAAVVSLLSGMVFFAGYRRKQKRELAKVRRVLEKLGEKEIEQEAETPVSGTAATPGDDPTFAAEETDPFKSTENRERSMMTPETEQSLLKKLIEFEKSGIFLENGFSLASLAIYLNTNTKYISYLIRNHKHTDFNSYVNELRINFAVRMLKEQPQWRQYKISTLAAESGFSSHSQFTAVFKTYTGLSPSVFIRHLGNKFEP